MINTLTIFGQISDKQQHFYLCIFYVKALFLILFHNVFYCQLPDRHS